MKYLLIPIIMLGIVVMSGCAVPKMNDVPSSSTAAPLVTMPDTTGLSKSRPASMNTAVRFTEFINDSGQGSADYSGQLTLVEVLRGPAALEKMRRDIPYYMVTIPTDREFLLAHFKYQLLDTSPNDVSRSMSRSAFELYRDGQFNTDDNKYILGPLPDFYGKIKKGESVEGWIAFTIPKDASNILIVYDRHTAGTDGIWFNI